MKWLSLALVGALALGCAVPPRRPVEPAPPPPPRITDPALSEGSRELTFAIPADSNSDPASLRSLLARLDAELARRPLALRDEAAGQGRVRLETSVAESVFRAAHEELSESARADVREVATPGEWRGAAVLTFGSEPPRLRVYLYLALAAAEERPELCERLLNSLEQGLAARLADLGAAPVSPR